MRKLIVPVVGALALIMGAAGGCGGAGLSGDDEPAAPAAAVAAAAPALTVTSIVDGDTVDLSDGRRVRLLGVDTPERGECGSEQASAFARSTLLNRPVVVSPDPTQDDTDSYGRALLYISVDGRDYSVAVTGAGWAEHYIFDNNPVLKAPTIEAAQAGAQRQRLGIWGLPHCTTPAPPSATPAPTSEQARPADTDDNVRRPAPVRAPVTAPAPEPEPAPAPKPAPKPEPKPAPEPARESGCHPSYVPCIPDGPDLDCGDIGHSVKVVGPDAYRLDADDDGTGCDSYS
ncbi:thermonuclease family protein [Pseudonocardia bannensis]|uniref:Thermonuclease family protein n=1 Tax=Pseudonocardia bannensis TaxID=630973 RepID=A0A848DHA7_9PSEU|nr:thermonuclease family protein [Pseudonocardia bannensis]NMH92062.1 thermonuclease family protein [Pseudonocardia bannensis]